MERPGSTRSIRTRSRSPASSPACARTKRAAARRSVTSRRAMWRTPGTSPTSRRNSGISTRPSSRPARTCAFIRCSTGRSSTSGNTSSARTFRPCRSTTTRAMAAVTGHSAAIHARTRSNRMPARQPKSSRSSRRASSRISPSGPAGRRTVKTAADSRRSGATATCRPKVSARSAEIVGDWSPPEMKSYSFRSVVLYCLFTAAVTVVAGYAFGKLVYTPWQISKLQAQSDLRDPATLKASREAGERIAARRTEKLGPEKQKELQMLWHELGIWGNLYYMGIRIQKNPMDLYMMQQLIFDVRPDYIIEAGTAYGGSAIYWAHMLEGMGLDDSKVLTVDITRYEEEAEKLPLWKKHVEFFLGSSTDPAIVEKIRQRVAGKKVLVVLDSNHAAAHVFDELTAYAPMVSKDSYIVVEDTNLDALPLPDLKYVEGNGGGPMAAVNKYLAGEGAGKFEQDLLRENFVLTFNPGGWLKRK